MSLPDNWWIDNMEDEPCDDCGVKPSKHAGHGSYTCEACYKARWCPKCNYDCRYQPHVCPTPEEIAEYKRLIAKEKEFWAELGVFDEHNIEEE